jgi:prepilin-type N-terminal cleavage/methylation domain-containing protein
MKNLRRSRKSTGFTMIELMVSMAVFLVVGGTAMSLFRQHANLFADQQTGIGLNISMRNALAQIQQDAVNAANGYDQTSTAGWPIGITVKNIAGGYDTLNIITAATIPAQLPTATCVNTSTAGTSTALIVPPPTVTASQFHANDEVLFLNGTGNQMDTVRLTLPASAAGGNILLTFAPTNPGPGQTTLGLNTAANDPLNITTQPFDPTDSDQLGVLFCQNTGAWVVDLSTVSYTVDANNNLTRTLGSGAPDIIADQIIGFKVGASLFTTAAGGSSTSYRYDGPAAYAARSVRSVRVSVIGRTPPTQFTPSGFTNTFDGGRYKIEALSLVVNPRNLSMND